MARLSCTVKLPNHRRAYVKFADRPGRSSCCTENVVSQLYWRIPQPLIKSGEIAATVRVEPSGALNAPSSLSCGIKSPFRSAQLLVALVTNPPPGLLNPDTAPSPPTTNLPT